MMSNNELLSLVKDSDKRDSWRIDALNKLIENLAIDQLYQIVNDTDRYDSWRKNALDAICEISTLSKVGISYSSLSISVGGSSFSINKDSISIEFTVIADNAAAILFKIVNDTDRYDNWRYQCLQYLIKIGHKEYLKRIADNSDRYDSWRDEAMRALING